MTKIIPLILSACLDLLAEVKAGSEENIPPPADASLISSAAFENYNVLTKSFQLPAHTGTHTPYM